MIYNFIKRFARLLKKGKEPKLSADQIDRLIEANKEILNKLQDK